MLRTARLEIDYARTLALLAAGARRRKHREAFAMQLRAQLKRIADMLEEIEREGWDA